MLALDTGSRMLGAGRSCRSAASRASLRSVPAGGFLL